MILPYINMNLPQVYTCSPSWTLLPSPSLYHPSESSQCTSPKHPECFELKSGLFGDHFGKLRRFLYIDMACMLSHFSHVWSGTPWTVAWQTPLSMVLSRQEYWNGLPFPPPGDIAQSIISVAQSHMTLCNLMDWSMTGFPVHHQLPELAHTHVHWVGDAIQPSHSLSSPSPPAFNFSQHQHLLQWVSTSHQVAKVLEFQPQHQSFQWTFRTDFL